MNMNLLIWQAWGLEVINAKVIGKKEKLIEGFIFLKNLK